MGKSSVTLSPFDGRRNQGPESLAAGSGLGLLHPDSYHSCLQGLYHAGFIPRAAALADLGLCTAAWHTTSRSLPSPSLTLLKGLRGAQKHVPAPLRAHLPSLHFISVSLTTSQTLRIWDL